MRRYSWKRAMIESGLSLVVEVMVGDEVRRKRMKISVGVLSILGCDSTGFESAEQICQI